MGRTALGALLGDREPITEGRITIPRAEGLGGEIRIRRDRWGVPHIDAPDDTHSYYGLGFCQAQDRAFQLEFFCRAGRGRLAELLGPLGVPMDRLSRRIGFHRSGQAQFANLPDAVGRDVSAYVAGINAGLRHGNPKVPHELALLRGEHSVWTGADALAVVKLLSFAMGTNWDAELARLEILSLDGAEALRDLLPLPTITKGASELHAMSGPALERLAQDIEAFHHALGLGGGSNNWVISGERTATGRPLLACDPHLPPSLPTVWYLAHMRSPDAEVMGASFVGSPGFAFGYNGHCAWGMTAGHVDNTDLFVETLGGPDGRSVLEGDAWVPCEVAREEIAVRWKKEPVVEEVLITKRGPIVTPALHQPSEQRALSMSATWLHTQRAGGMIHLHHSRDFDSFREHMRLWPGLALNMLYADVDGHIGWQLAGRAPVRKKGWGLVPLPGSDPEVGWEDEPVPFEALPFVLDPPEGFLATANNSPQGQADDEADGVYLGADFFDAFRRTAINERLAERDNWSVDDAHELQLDTLSLPWRGLSPAVRALAPSGDAARRAREILLAWNGRVDEDEPGAAVFELFLGALTSAVVRAKAPRAAAWALGQGFTEIAPNSSFALRRTAHLLRLVDERPGGWLAPGETWDGVLEASLAHAVERLEATAGADPTHWRWGQLRTLTLQHPLTEAPLLGALFDLGPMPMRGDTNTIHACGADPTDPLSNPIMIPSMRMVVDVGRFEDNRWVLAGGQSGNPCSRHYDDMTRLWQRGEAPTIAWTDEAIARDTVATLTLQPGEAAHDGDGDGES